MYTRTESPQGTASTFFIFMEAVQGKVSFEEKHSYNMRFYLIKAHFPGLLALMHAGRIVVRDQTTGLGPFSCTL